MTDLVDMCKSNYSNTTLRNLVSMTELDFDNEVNNYIQHNRCYASSVMLSDILVIVVEETLDFVVDKLIRESKFGVKTLRIYFYGENKYNLDNQLLSGLENKGFIVSMKNNFATVSW